MREGRIRGTPPRPPRAAPAGAVFAHAQRRPGDPALPAFFFGYALTLGPVLGAGVPLRRALALAVASDTVSIGTMELVDNGFILVVPGALAAGLADALFRWSLGLSLVIAFVLTVPVNRLLIARVRGHAVVHQLHAR